MLTCPSTVTHWTGSLESTTSRCQLEYGGNGVGGYFVVVFIESAADGEFVGSERNRARSPADASLQTQVLTTRGDSLCSFAVP